jgi:hypothetical protein
MDAMNENWRITFAFWAAFVVIAAVGLAVR